MEEAEKLKYNLVKLRKEVKPVRQNSPLNY